MYLYILCFPHDKKNIIVIIIKFQLYIYIYLYIFYSIYKHYIISLII